MPPEPTPPTAQTPPAALVYTVPQLAAALGISKRLVHRKHAAGELPAAVRIGRLVRWQRAVIDRWVADGCPPRRR